MGFAGLCQSDRFQKLVVSAEAAGKNNHSVGFFDEHELAGKEKMKVHELRIVTNERIGVLYRGKTDIDAEALLPTRTFVPGLHDARSRARDHHQPCSRKLLGEAPRQMVIWISFFHSRRTEDADLAHMPIRRKMLKARRSSCKA